MNDQEILSRVAEVIGEITEDDREIKMEDKLIEDIGLVSIGFVEMIVQLEEVFDISFPDNMLTDNNLETVRDVIENIKNLIRE